MKLLFQEQIVEYKQTPSTEEVIEKINELLQDKFYFSHLLADGEKILEEPELFLVKNISNVYSFEIIAITAKEYINGLLLSAEEYTERAVPRITALADEFYNNPTPTNWEDLSQLLEGIQWILMMIETVDQSIARPSNWKEVIATTVEMQSELGNLEEALENTDTVLIADMLQYELLPVFESLALEMKKTIDTEGTRHDLN